MAARKQKRRRVRVPGLRVLGGLLLLPVCVVVTRVLVVLIGEIRAVEGDVSLSAWALLAGFVLWLLLYLTLSRPVRTYVFAHEMTHAMWGYLMGAKVSDLKVSTKGGSVVVSKNNVWITLAPYFFPFYTVCVILLYGLLSLFLDMRTYEPFWLGLVGLTWGFHLTFTVSMLMQHQTDVTEYGRLSSYVLIYLLNVLGVCLWVIAVASPTLDSFAEAFGGEMGRVWSWGVVGISWVGEWLSAGGER